MIFKRNKIMGSSTSMYDYDKIGSKIETLYVCTMCFAAACLSFTTFEVGRRSQLVQSVGKSAAFGSIFRRSYSMKIKIMLTNVIMGLIMTITLAFGDIYRIPYLHVPWLVNTMRGILFYEGPALLGLIQSWLGDGGIPAGAFIFISILLFIEQLCLWFDVLMSLKTCWIEYNARKSPLRGNECSTEENKKSCSIDDPKIPEPAVAKSRLADDDTYSAITNPTTTFFDAKSACSDTNVRLRMTQNSNDLALNN